MSDVYFYYSTLILQAHPTKAAYDGSSKSKSVSLVGATISATPFTTFGGGCFEFDGVNDYISIGVSGDTDLSASGGVDFTCEINIYARSLKTNNFLISRRVSAAYDYVLYIQDGVLQVVLYGSSAIIGQVVSPTPFPINTKVHVAFSVSGNTLRLFQDGVLQGAATFIPPVINGETTIIGGHVSNTTRYFDGFMDNIRITRGVARYVDNFTPPGTMFDEVPEVVAPLSLKTYTLTWANNETREQAWPGENSIKETTAQSPEKICPITSVSALSAPPSRNDFGFIEGVVTRKSVPAAGRHVICLDERFNLIAETTSAANGYYRFDNLSINGLYAIHAYDNDTYQYAPVGADRRTPEAYP